MHWWDDVVGFVFVFMSYLSPSVFFLLTGGFFGGPYAFLACITTQVLFFPSAPSTSCLALTSNLSHASFAVPLIEIFFADIFSQNCCCQYAGGAIPWVHGPERGALGDGQGLSFLTFSLLSSSVILAPLIFHWVEKNPSGMFWLNQWTLLPLFYDGTAGVGLGPSPSPVPHILHIPWDKCFMGAHAACSNISLMKAISSAPSGPLR